MSTAANVTVFSALLLKFGVSAISPLAGGDELAADCKAVEAEYARVAEIAAEAERIVNAWYDGEASGGSIDIALQELRTAIANAKIAAPLIETAAENIAAARALHASLSADFPPRGGAQ